MARYSQKFKERVVARLLPPESSPVEAVSQTVGISVGTLERWRAEVLAKPSGEEARHWTPAARLEAVIATAAMHQSARSAWCREHGVYPTELDTWTQDAIGGLGEPRAPESVAVKQELTCWSLMCACHRPLRSSEDTRPVRPTGEAIASVEAHCSS